MTPIGTVLAQNVRQKPPWEGLIKAGEEGGVLSKPILSTCLCEGNDKERMETKGKLKSKWRTWFCLGKRLKHIYMLRGCASKQVDWKYNQVKETDSIKPQGSKGMQSRVQEEGMASGIRIFHVDRLRPWNQNRGSVCPGSNLSSPPSAQTSPSFSGKTHFSRLHYG